MAKIRTRPTSSQAVSTVVSESVPQIIVEKEIVYQTVEVPVEVIKTVEVPKIEIIEKIIEKEVIVPEYITVTKIETVEIPVEKIVEKEVKVYDFETLQKTVEKLKRTERKVSRYQVALAACVILTMIVAVL